MEPTSSAGMPTGGLLVQRDRDAAAPLAHLAPVLDGVADVAEDGAQRGGDRLAVLRRGHAVDLEVHPRLGDDAELVLGRRVGVDLLQGADGVPADDELRVHDEVDGAAERVERGGDRVDEERHVVGDDLDDGVPAGPALRLDGRVRHVDVGGADGTPAGEVALGQRGTEQVLRLAREKVLGRGVAVEHVQQPVDVLPGLLGSVFGGGAQLLGPGLLERRRHRWFVFLHLVSRARVFGCRSRVSPLFTCWTARPYAGRSPGRWRTPRGYSPERLPWGRDHAEWAPTVTTPGPRRDGLVRALTAVREAARAQAEDVLGHVPDTGDRTTGRAVDDFVEQAADALRALDESVAETLRALVPERR